MNLMPFQDQPFNGDTFICEEFLKLKEKYKVEAAIETGSCIYSTTRWFCQNFNEVWTVEINPEYALYGQDQIRGFNANVYVRFDSVEFISEILKVKLAKDKVCIFFLDAHWGNNCPLKDEIKAIASLGLVFAPVVAIHDFMTNHPEELGYDTYNGESLNLDYIMDQIRMLELAYGCNYNHYFNSPDKSTGAKRGIIYLTPQI